MILREALENTLLLGLARRGLDPVVEEVVALLQRLLVGCALGAPAAIDVEVREDAKEPRAEVRPRRVRLPAAEGPRVGLLHQVLRLLFGARDASCHAIDLICKC